MSRSRLRAPRTPLWWVLVIWALLGSGLAAAGEPREPTREPDRVYGVVAGEADASAVVQNPANLGYLRGFNGVIDVSATVARARRRSDGAGLFVGVPLPWRIASVGAGLQFMWRTWRDEGDSSEDPGDDEPVPTRSQDELFGKFSLAFSLPLERWVPGVSLGVTYSRLFSAVNSEFDGLNDVDLGISWWANRFVSLALVGRHLNQPIIPTALGGRRINVVLDPEFALRPLGTPALEVAAGARFQVRGAADEPFQPFRIQPRGRLLAGYGGVRVFIEAERIAVFREAFDTQPLNGVRLTSGLQFDTPHFGLAGGLSLLGGSVGGDGVAGGVGRLRFSHERYQDVLPARPRVVTRLSLSKYGGERGTAELVATIDELARRNGRALLIETRGSAHGFAQLEEIREAVLRFRSGGGDVAMYMEGGNLKAYFLASAGNRIIAHPEVPLTMIGMGLRTLYFGELLNKLGAKAEFLRIAQYKGTPERYSRSSPTGPVARQRKLLLTDKWNHVIRLIARERGHDAEVVAGWIEEMPAQPSRARQLGIVDALAWPDKIDADLEAWLGRGVRIRRPSKAPDKEESWGKQPHVAVLFVDGQINTGVSAKIPLLNIDVAGSKTITEQIKKLRKDPTVKAIVVRINSRGGSVRASKAIAHELELTRGEGGKPVVVSLGNVAASGGYYVATGGDYIYADATTTTGSIGIFFPKVDLSGLLDKFGVGVDMIGYGQNVAINSWYKAYTDSERDEMMERLQADYDRFVGRVARARNMSPERVDEVARGRVWSGVRATDVGLVDAYGGLREAVIRARRMAGMRPIDRSVVYYPAPKNLLQKIRALFGISIPNPLRGATAGVGLASFGLSNPILRVLRELPIGLWMAETPEALALPIEETHIE